MRTDARFCRSLMLRRAISRPAGSRRSRTTSGRQRSSTVRASSSSTTPSRRFRSISRTTWWPTATPITASTTRSPARKSARIRARRAFLRTVCCCAGTPRPAFTPSSSRTARRRFPRPLPQPARFRTALRSCAARTAAISCSTLRAKPLRRWRPARTPRTIRSTAAIRS